MAELVSKKMGWEMAAPLPSTIRGESTALSSGSGPGGDSFGGSFDGWLWYACKQLGGVILHAQTGSCRVFRGNGGATAFSVSPQGNRAALADDRGNVRLFLDLESPEKSTDVKILSGPIRALCWQEGGGKPSLLVAGDGGRGRHVIGYDVERSCGFGTFVGHDKRASCAAAWMGLWISGGEDGKVVVYDGSGTRLRELRRHSNFVNSIKGVASGWLATVSSDRTLLLYRPTGGDPHNLQEVEPFKSLHDATIYAVEPIDDNTLATSGADGCVSVLDVQTGQVKWKHKVGEGLSNFVVGLASLQGGSGGDLMCLTLKGWFHALDVQGQRKVRDIQGNQGSVTCMRVDAPSGTVYAGSDIGTLCKLDNGGRATSLQGGENGNIYANVHRGKVATVEVVADLVLSTGWDDKVRAFRDNRQVWELPLKGQPAFSASGDDCLVVACAESLTTVVPSTGAVASVTDTDYKPTSLSCLSGEKTLLAAGGQDGKIRVYDISDDGALHLVSTIEDAHRSAVSALSFDSSGSMLASGDVKEVKVWNVSDWTPLIKGRWQFHTSTIKSVSWSPDGVHLASCGTDESVLIWCIRKKMKRLQYKFAHRGGAVAVEWFNPTTICTAGADGLCRKWDLESDISSTFG